MKNYLEGNFKKFVAEVFPDDTAIEENYPENKLIEIYPELWDDFENGKDSSFAKYFFGSGFDEYLYDQVRELWDEKEKVIQELKAEIVKISSKKK